jgi:hypothetical protein
MRQVENVIAKAMVADALAASMGAVGAFYKTNMRGYYLPFLERHPNLTN